MKWFILLAALTVFSHAAEQELELVARQEDAQEVDGFINVAFKKKASHTSEIAGAKAEKAVDGNTAQNWAGSRGSCTHTRNRGVDVWKVDLGKVYQIDQIRVWGLESAAQSAYMRGATVWVDKNLCGRLIDNKKEGAQTVKCENPALMAGRHISISAGETYLAICEVQVLVKKADMEKTPESVAWPGESVGGFTNVALNSKIMSEKPTATQSSTIHRGDAPRANDGNRFGKWHGNSVTHTNRNGVQFWQVDLGKIYKIHHITIYGRTDCCSERIQGARVVVGMQQVATNLQKPEKPTDPIKVDLSGRDEPVYGRKVSIELLNNYLSLAEVEVWVADDDVMDDKEAATPNPELAVGQEIDGFYNVAMKKKATQTSEAHGGTADKAVDGWTAQNWAGRYGSCTHTRNRGSDVWKVDLGRVYQIDHIRVYGLNNHASSYLAGAMVWVGSNLCGRLINSKKVQTVKCENAALMAGQHVSISAGTTHLAICEVQVMVKKDDVEKTPALTVWPGESVGGLTNVALNRGEKSTAKQSSTIHGGDARRANDGNRNGHWGGASVTHTNGNGLQYWEVDLGRVYKIHHITIYGRTDCCSERIQGARVIVGGSFQVAGDLKKPDPAASPIKIDLSERDDPVYGRRVSVEILNNYLMLAEVEVWVADEDVMLEEAPPTRDPALSAGQEMDEFFNVAWRRKATQSSEAHGGTADKAVDGWTSQSWRGKDGSCTHTKNRGSDTWTVDLGKVYQIDHVKVWGLDNHASSYMNGAMVWVDKNLCGRLIDNKKNGPQTVKCDSPNLMAGRYVSISAGYTYLSICEVQVMVKKADIEKTPKIVTWPGEKAGDFTNVALNHKIANENSTATQSGTIHGGVARRANDGNRNGHWGGGSVTHTDRHGLQYWEVDLGRVYKIHHITIYGRTDCCSERIQGARVWVGRMIVAANVQKPAKPADPIKIDLSKMEADDMVFYGKKVTIELLNNYLSLAEVEVWVANDDVFGEEKPTMVPTWENVALRRPTKQSSNLGHYYSGRAIDNFPAKLHFNHGSCTHTQREAINSWEVDLESEYYIDHIKVMGRNDNDGAARRINGATILVDGRTVGGFVYKNANEAFKFPLNGMKGRVVKIVKMNDYLTLCEVQVMVNHDFEPDESSVEPIAKDVPNLAIKAKVTTSSTMFGGSAASISDGNVESNLFRGSCYMSGPAQNGNWVKLALEKETKVGSVAVYPRLDYNAYQSIDGAEVRASGELCGTISYEAGKLYYELSCDGATASEITISKLGWLSFCEVVVNAAS